MNQNNTIENNNEIDMLSGKTEVLQTIPSYGQMPLNNQSMPKNVPIHKENVENMGINNNQNPSNLTEAQMIIVKCLEAVKKNLYAPVLTPKVEALIVSYVEAYHKVLDYCLKAAVPNEDKMKELELLSGPINEIYSPNNPKMFDGNTYPAVDLILNKVNEYGKGVEKGFVRTLKKPEVQAEPIQEMTRQNASNSFGFLSIFFVFTLVIVFSIALGYILFLLKK